MLQPTHLVVLRARLAGHAFELAAVRLQLLLRKANFNPGQVRDELGRWVDQGGGDDATGRVHLAQTDGQRQYSVDLNEEEGLGGHTKRDHVGKTDDELLAFVRRDRHRSLFVTVARIREGTFLSLESANDFVNRTLEVNQGLVDLVASGRRDEAVFNSRFGYVTGREAFRLDADSEPYMRSTYEVLVVIRHDRRSSRGYRVHTAYPINRDPR